MRGLAIALLLASTALAQTEGPRRTMVEVRYLNSRDLVKSGFLQQFGVVATTDPSGKFIMITGDRPADVYAAEAALKKMDAKPQNIELVFHVIGAVAQPVTDDMPPEAEQAVKQLKTTFPQYKGYRLLETAYMRVTDGGRGVVDGKLFDGKGSYRIAADRPHIRTGSPNTISIDELSLRGSYNVSDSGSSRTDSFQVQTNVDFKEGQKLVVGKSSVADQAIFLVLSAKVVD